MLFFTAPQSLAVDVAKGVAVVTCPAFLFSDFFAAPLVNGVLYAAASFVVLVLLPRKGSPRAHP
jgi:hypothetical protein